MFGSFGFTASDRIGDISSKMVDVQEVLSICTLPDYQFVFPRSGVTALKSHISVFKTNAMPSKIS